MTGQLEQKDMTAEELAQRIRDFSAAAWPR